MLLILYKMKAIGIQKYLLISTLLLAAATLRCSGQIEMMHSEVAFLVDSVGNRYPSSTGDLTVRQHILRHFASYGLTSYEQPFEIVENVWGEGSMKLLGDGIEKEFVFGKDFDVSGRSAADSLEAPYIVVAGVVPDPLRCLLRDKVVICLQKAPDSGTGARVLTPSDVIQASGLAMISVLPPGIKISHRKSKGNRSYKPRHIPMLSIDYDMLSAFIPQSVADRMTAGSIYNAPESKRIRLSTRHFEKRIPAANIVGLKRGSGDKFIIVGAHYDTCAPSEDTGEIRRGANDNASGVAVLMALALRLSQIETRHSILFVAFGGEEKGFLGSMHFVSHLPLNKDDVAEMINLDMVGRMNNDVLYYKQYNDVHIKPTDVSWEELVLREQEGGLSDYYDFANAGIPVTYFHTGEDPVIHTSADTSDRLNYEGMDTIQLYLFNYIITVLSVADGAVTRVVTGG